MMYRTSHSSLLKNSSFQLKRLFSTKYKDVALYLTHKEKKYKYFDISKLEGVKCLPYSIRILLESAVRNCDGVSVKAKDIDTILDWKNSSKKQKEIAFRPSRVLLQDFTGVPAMVDFAAMRSALVEAGKDIEKINPQVPVDLVIDHSVQVDYSGNAQALEKNEQKEMERNEERFSFLKWAANSFRNVTVVPPGSGIVHQVNLEYLARLVFMNEELYPDSVVGTDSHSTMINGLGVLGWGVGGIEAEAVMLGQAISMVLPEVIGVKLSGLLAEGVTATDLVLSITSMLRQTGVVGKFVEYFGPGVSNLTLADRATIANMAPEYGATMGYFPIDKESLNYLDKTGRPQANIEIMEKYLIKNCLYADHTKDTQIQYSETISLDLASIKPCLAGPKRPQDLILLSEAKDAFRNSLVAPKGFKGYGITPQNSKKTITFEYQGQNYTIGNGSVVIAAITSCTNTSNPGVMIGAGILAKKAVEKGLAIKPYIKTSLSPGSKAVKEYYSLSGLDKYLEKLGFYQVGYGCMTCIGNSGDVDEALTKVVNNEDLIVASVLSGNRNFEGRIHPLTRANFLTSPPVVVAYAISGRCDINFSTEPLGCGTDGKLVYLRDIWPTKKEIDEIESKTIKGEMFKKAYANVYNGTEVWRNLKIPDNPNYQWKPHSTYIKRPPYFDGINGNINIENFLHTENIHNARVLLLLGDSITTDHISPAGNIAYDSPAGKYLKKHNIKRKDFNTYGSRRGNHEVMILGTFANIRLENKMCPGLGPKAKHSPSGVILPVADVASLYREEGKPLIIIAGKNYGSGSSRDWAAKGPALQGIKVIIAESFERIHRSNLVGLGILPLQFIAGQSAQSLGLTGEEQYSIKTKDAKVNGMVEVTPEGKPSFQAICRIDTEVEEEYYLNGGILPCVLRKIIKQ